MKVLFLHGWQSVPGGVKPMFLARHGHEVINPKLPDDDFAEAVRIAQADFDKHQAQVVVGSSRGGAVAMNINSGEANLVLLCPAWKKWGIRARWSCWMAWCIASNTRKARDGAFEGYGYGLTRRAWRSWTGRTDGRLAMARKKLSRNDPCP
jgi:Alpha/beta hydrolase family